VDSEAPSELVSAIAEEIMTYLNANAAAKDTPRGILQWWLAAGREKADVAIVEQALERLVAQGRIRVRITASGAPLYFGPGPDKRDRT
jgi:hypothetical protein